MNTRGLGRNANIFKYSKVESGNWIKFQFVREWIWVGEKQSQKKSPQRSVSFSHVGHGPWFPSISALRSVSVSHIFTALSATKLSTTAPLYSHHFREILQINFSRMLKTIGYRNPKLCQTFLTPPQGHTRHNTDSGSSVAKRRNEAQKPSECLRLQLCAP